jgi:putative YjhG/YagF family dehydratase
MTSSDLFPSSSDLFDLKTMGPGPAGELPLTEAQLRDSPSGDLFGWTQNAGMGWNPRELGRPEVLILSTTGGLRRPDGTPEALGFHTGHFEVILQVAEAAKRLREIGAIPFAGYVSDPCDGRSQGTTGMMDSLPYRNDAAIVLRRLVRSLPTRKGIIGVATCDKGLPAMMMALASFRDLPWGIVPGGVTLPAKDAEDAGKVQTIGARFSHGLISLKEAAEMGCRACGSPGGGCQFLGTAATSQVVAEAFGMTVPHAALAPSGQSVWLKLAAQTAEAVFAMAKAGHAGKDFLNEDAIHNAMAVHAAFGGSTNLLLHIPAIAFSAGLDRPSVEDWTAINRKVPRLVDALPNGPIGHPTVRVFLAGGVPEVMLHLRELGLLRLGARTITGQTIDPILDAWAKSERRKRMRELLYQRDGIDPETVILNPAQAKAAGLSSTVVFPKGNLAPEGSVIKATAIDPSMVGADGVYRHEGPARVFTSEPLAIRAIKNGGIKPGDVLVLMGRGPMGCGMEEIYQITSALKHLPFGKQVAVVTDARFSGVSTGACIGHVGPEALAGGPLGRLRENDRIRIIVDRNTLEGSVDMLGDANGPLDPQAATKLLDSRPPVEGLAPDPNMPDDTKLWAMLQQMGGGTWGGCVYDEKALQKKLGLTIYN